MAWNEPGGGNNRDPWGSNGGGRGPSGGPPDLEELLKDFKRRVLNLFGVKGKPGEAKPPAGAGGLCAALPIFLILLVVWMLFDSAHIISPRERGVVLRFGKFDRILQPGPRLTFPRPIENVVRVDVTKVRTTSETVRMLTKDENLVDIDFAVQYTVSDARDYQFNVRDPDETLTQVSEAAIRQVVGSRTLDDVLVGSRAEIALAAKGIMQTLLNNYEAGLSVSAINLQDASVPSQVKDAFDDAIRAREDEQRSVNDARADASKWIPDAKGRAARVIQESEAYRDVLIAKANGDAERFAQLVAQYRLAPEVTRQRLYLETMEEILAKTPKVLIDNTKGGNNMLYLPLDRMMPSADAPARAAAGQSVGAQ